MFDAYFLLLTTIVEKKRFISTLSTRDSCQTLMQLHGTKLDISMAEKNDRNTQFRIHYLRVHIPRNVSIIISWYRSICI